jgi:NAD(P)-dependent dehydrogenase (short-subunit alcohol dehydrogenase family)
MWPLHRGRLRGADRNESRITSMDELRFDGRTAIVTGAGNGLGRAYALLLASRGANVLVNDLGGAVDGSGRDGGAAQAVVNEISQLGGTAVADTNSVASAEGGIAIVRGALEAFGGVDIVVNNAGILRDRSFHNLSPEDFDAVLDVHLRGTFFVTAPAYRHMRERGYGRVVVTTSASGLFGNFGQANYGAAKMGVVGLAKTLAQEGAKRDIRANVIAPGAFTRMSGGIIPEESPAMPPELVAPAVAYLCHESCSLNGEILSAFAGRVARAFVAETVGYFNEHLTVEDVADNLTTILDHTEILEPRSGMESTQILERFARK